MSKSGCCEMLLFFFLSVLNFPFIKSSVLSQSLNQIDKTVEPKHKIKRSQNINSEILNYADFNFSNQNPRSKDQFTRVFAQAGKIFMYRFEFVHCVKKRNSSSLEDWVQFHKELTMLIGLPHSELLGSFNLSYNCRASNIRTNFHSNVNEVMKTINIEINLKSSFMKPNVAIEVFTPEDRPSLTLLKKIEIIQIIETNVKSYKVVNSIANYFRAILNWGMKSNSKLAVAININPCNLHRLTRVLTSYDSTNIIGVVIYASVNESSLNFKNNCQQFKTLAQTIISSSSTYIRKRVVKREIPFLDIPDIFRTNLPKLDCSNNTPPVAKKKSVTFTFQSNEFSHIEINEALFTDREDGNLKMLKLKLTWENGVQVKPDDWIQFSSVLKLIYAFSTYDIFEKQPKGGYTLLATATDQCDSSVVTTVYVQIESPFLSPSKITCGYMVLLVEFIADKNMPYINILAELIDKVATFNNITSSNLIVLKVFRSFHKGKSVYSVLFTLKVCNNCIKEIFLLSKNLNQGNNFKQFLAPKFNYNTVLLSKCGENSSPQTVYQIDSFVLSENRTTVHEISKATFFDIEDGFLENLTLQIHNTSINGVLVTLHKQSVVFYQYKEKINVGSINITVIDSSKKISSLIVKVVPSYNLNLVNKWFTFTMDAYYDEFYSNDYIITKLLHMFSKFFGGGDLIYDLVLLGFDRKGIFPLSIEIRLSLVSINYKNTIEIEKMKSEIMQKDGKATIGFATLFLPHVRNIHCVYHNLESSNQKNELNIINNIPPLFINASQVFYYSIPVDTFYDKIDGNTKNLILRMTSLDGQALQKNSWMQFDSERQKISVVLTLDMMQEEKMKSFKFVLIAINSRNHTANLTINLIATRRNNPLGGALVQLAIKDDINSLVDDMQILIPLLIKFGDIMKTSIEKELKSFSRENGLSTIVFVYNFTSNAGLCDHEEMNCLKNKSFALSFNSNKKNLELIPDVYLMKLKISTFGICKKNVSILDLSEKIQNKLSQSLTGNDLTEINSTLPPVDDNKNLFKGPEIRLPLPRIFVSFCKSVVYYLNPDTFFDEKDGNAKTLDIELMHKIEGKVSNSSWIQWDKKLQRIYGFLKLSDYDYMSARSENQYFLKATDSDGYSVEADINFILPIKRLSYFYKISSTFQIKSENGIEANHQSALWNKLTSFTGVTKIQIITFLKLNENQILLEWFICETDEKYCPNKMIEALNVKLLSGKDPSNQFFNVMLPEYEVLETKLSVEEICAIEKTKTETKPTNFIKPAQTQFRIINSSIFSPKPTQTLSTLSTNPLNSPAMINLPPIVLKSVPILYVFPCKITEYKLNEDVFFDPEDGLTRSLKVTTTNELFLYNATTQTISIQFMPNSPSFFQIIAADKYGLTVAQNITVIKAEKELLGYNISFYGTTVRKLANDNDLHAMITQRLHLLWQDLFTGNILVQSINKHNYNYITIIWSPCNLECSNKYYQNIRASIFQKDNLQNNIVNLFAPDLIITRASLTVSQPCIDILNNNHTQSPLPFSSFITIEDIKSQRMEQLKSNSPPEIKSRLPILIAYKCRLFSFGIPENFCYDLEDGFTPNLRLQLLSLKKENLSSKHWLRLNEKLLVLYGTLKSADIIESRNKILSYYLCCRDKLGAVVFQQIDIIIAEPNIIPSHLITFYSYLHLSQNDTEVQSQILDKIALFLGEEDTKNIEVKNFSRDSSISDHITLSWYNCTIDDPCSPEINLLKNKFFNKLNLNSQFALAMIPEFVMIGGKFNVSLLCASLQNTSQSLSIKNLTIKYTNHAPVARQPLQDIIVPSCSTFSFRIPEDTFFDIEDGNTRNLKLNLLTEELLPIPKTSWVQFVESTQVVYGFSKLIDFKELNSSIDYFLEATDNGGYKAYTKVVLAMPARPKIPFVVNITLSRFFDLNSSDLIEQIFLAGQISYFMGDKDVSQIIVVDYMRKTHSVFISWSNCSSINENCPHKTKNLLQNKLLEKSSPSSTFVNKIKTYYSVQKITLDSYSHCFQPPKFENSFNASFTAITNEPPKVIRYIPPQYVDLCQPFIYRIPEDIFTDEDGSTSSLKLKLLDINFKEVRNDSCIILGINSTINGIIKLSDIHKKNNDFRYLLSASDSSGLETKIPLSLKTRNYFKKLSYHLVLELKIQFTQADTNLLLNLIYKINNYFGTADNPDILPISFENKRNYQNIYVLAWTFCSLKFETCPRDKLNDINRKLFESDGNVLENFHSLLKPDFSVLSLKTVYSNICSENNVSLYPSSKQVPFLPNAVHPIGVQPISIFINQCRPTVHNVSEDFLKLNSKNLPSIITLRYENGSRVSSQSWIQLNEHNSIVYGYARTKLEEIPRTYILQAEYTDKNNQLLPLKVNIAPLNVTELHFFVSITFKVNLNITLNDVLMINLLKTKLQLYLKVDSISIVYLFQNTSRFYAKFSFCVNNSKTCNYTHVEYILSMLFKRKDFTSTINIKRGVHQSFVSALLPEFTDISVIDELSGPCSFRLNPLKDRTSLNICVNPCGFFRYKISQNIFFDPLPNYNAAYITEVMKMPRFVTSWLHYNDSALEFYGIPTERVRMSEPETGYRYLLFAYEYNGGVAKKWIQFKICNNTPKHENNIEVKLACPIQNENNYVAFKSILEQISYIYFQKNLSSLHLYNYTFDENIIKFIFSRCGAAEVFVKEINGTIINNCVVFDFSIFQARDNPPMVNSKELRFRPKFCQTNIFNIPIDTFVDNEDGNIHNLYLFITFENYTLIPDHYWINLVNNKLHVLFILEESKNNTYQYYLNAKNSKNQIARIPLVIEILDDFPKLSNFHFIRLKSKTVQSIVPLINNLFATLELFSNVSYAVNKYNLFENQSISLTFFKCSLTAMDCGCSADCVAKIYLIPEFYIEHLEMNQTHCDFNNAPLLMNAISNIIIPSKGYLIYQIPKNMFYDKEDGWTRNLLLSIISPDNCWLQFSEKDQTIYAIASDKTIKTYLQKNLSLVLTATDSLGKVANTTIDLFFEPIMSYGFFVSILFQITFVKKVTFLGSCLQDKFFIFNKMSIYLNTTLSLKSAFKAADDMFIEIIVASSTMRFSPCDYLATDRFLKLIEDKEGSFADGFLSFMLPDYIPRFISVHKGPTCKDLANTPPRLNGTLNIDVLSTFSFVEKRLPQGLAYDNEDGNIFNLNITLLHSNGTQVNNDWIYFDEKSKVLFVLGSHQTAERQPKNGYEFMLSIQDSRKAMVSLKFKIVFKLPIKTDIFSITEIINFIPSDYAFSTKSDIPSIIAWKKHREKLLNFHLDLVSYKKIEQISKKTNFDVENISTYNVTWRINNKNESCEFESLKHIENIYRKYFNTSSYQVNNKCFNKSISQLKTNKTIEVYLDPCQEVVYKLEKNMFWNEKDENTEAFYVKAILTYPKSSDIAYDSLLKTFYGTLVLDKFLKYGHIEFYLEATDSDQLKSSSMLKFFMKPPPTKYFEIESKLLYFSNESTKFLTLFRYNILTFLNFENEGLVFYNYNATSSDEQMTLFVLNFSICITTPYCHIYSRVISSLTSDKGELNEGFINAMNNKILPIHIVSRSISKCFITTEEKQDATVGLCMPLSYKLPNKSLDNKTVLKSLNWSLKAPLFTWIKFDSFTQTLTGRPIKRDIPTSESKFNIKFDVTFNDGIIRSKNITIKYSTVFVSYVVNVQLISKKSFADSYELRNKLQEKFDAIKSNNSINVYDISTPSVARFQIFWVSVFSCSNHFNQCNPVKQQEFFSTFVNSKNEIRDHIIKEFSDTFVVLNVTEGNSCNKELLKKKPLVLKLKTCQQLHFSLPTFLDNARETTEHYELLLENGNSLPSYSPVQFDKVNSAIYGFVTHDFALNLSRELRYVLRLHKPPKISIGFNVTVLLPRKKPRYNFVVRTELLSYLNTEVADVDILLKFIIRVSSFISVYFRKASRDTISIKSYTRRGDKIPQRLIIEWFNCSNIENCSEDKDLFNKTFITDLLMNPLFARDINQEYGFVHRKTSFYNIDSCKKDFELPISVYNLTSGNVTVFLNSRSFFERNLEKHIFDGINFSNNLSVVLTFTNKSFVPFNHWLQFDNQEKKLFGFPDKTILPHVSYWYKLIVSDDKGPKVEKYIEIKIQAQMHAGTQLSVDITCADHRPPIILHIRDIASKVAKKFKLRLKDILLDFFYLTRKQHIYLVLNLPSTVLKENFSKLQYSTTSTCRILKIFKVNSLAYFADNNINLSANGELIVLNGIPDLDITCGKPLVYKIPVDAFYFISMKAEKLIFELDDKNFSDLHGSSFIKLSSDTFYIFYSLKECLHIKSSRNLNIKASDHRGNFAIDSFKLTKNGEFLQCCNTYIELVFQLPYSPEDDLFKTYQILQNDIYDDYADNLRIVNVLSSLSSEGISVLLTNKSLFTNNSCNQNISYRPFLFPVFETTSPLMFQGKMQNFFTNLVHASVMLCNTLDKSFFELSSEALKASDSVKKGKNISSEEWFLYFLPLFILAFMVVTSCICFYSCQCLHRICFKKPKNLLVDASSEIIEKRASQEKSFKSSFTEIPLEPVSTSGSSKIRGFQKMPQKKNVSVCKKPKETKYFNKTKDKYEKQLNSKKSNVENKKSNLLASLSSPSKNSCNNSLKPKVITKETYENKEILRLPAIPSGPPPPYSPPRRQRVFSQNIIPTYYEKYAQKKITEETFPATQKAAKSSSSSSAPSKNSKKYLLIKKSKKRKLNLKRFNRQNNNVPNTSFSSSTLSKSELSDNSCEQTPSKKCCKKNIETPDLLQSIELRKKTKKFKEANKKNLTRTQIMRYIDDVNAAKVPNEKQSKSIRSLYSRYPIRHKFAKPFLYDYLPVRRKQSEEKYQFYDPGNLYSGLSSGSSSNRGSVLGTRYSNGTKTRSRYLDTLANLDESANGKTNHKNVFLQNKSNKKIIEKGLLPKRDVFSNRNFSLNDLLEDSHF
ncbi:uncharacterized protein LOC105846337 isoform X1 [Hydra vulgaris]|uniref:Uncharacterized protein LOC105846337 isoform X1 n=2 Tax=Hydra vulgaris TaxID=6087 RepID=A0ABM4BT56_HYDVU